MTYYVGLDVSVKTTAVCIVDENGKIVKEISLCTEPESLSDWLRKTGLCFERVGHEAGPLSSWLHEGLAKEDLPVICVEARHMQSALCAMRNKTDRNDAHGIAQMMRTGWFRQVHVKSHASQELRLLLLHRRMLLDKRRDIENALRGTLKVFGIKIGQVSRLEFSQKVMAFVADKASICAVVEPILKVRDVLMEQYHILHRNLKDYVRKDAVCQRLMTAQGIGPVTAATYKSGVDLPERFAKSRNVGAHFGITPRRYASGETDRQGRISKCGDAVVRAALYNAAHIVLTRAKKWSSLRAWGMKLAKRAGMEKAKVAVARKLAVILHRMWLDESDFRWGQQEKEVTV